MMADVTVAIILSVIDFWRYYYADIKVMDMLNGFSYPGYVIRPIGLIIFIVMVADYKNWKNYLYLVIPWLLCVVVYSLVLIPSVREQIFYYYLDGEEIKMIGGPLRYTSHIFSFGYLVYLEYLSIRKLKKKHINKAIYITICALVIIGAVTVETINSNNGVFLLNTSSALGALIYYMFLDSQANSQDILTGLFNRTTYFEDLSKMEKEVTGLIQFDMNGLKYINDHYGHQKGDEALRSIGNIINENCDKNMYAYRLGGDEFVVLTLKTDKEVILNYIETVKKELLENNHLCAIGYAIKENPDTSVDELFKTAENDMYKDKAEFYQNSGLERRNKEAN